MSETIATGKALRQTERYTYWSIHWGFPMLPAIGGFVLLSSTTPNAALAWWAVALTLAGCAGLVVTHTTMRRRAPIEPEPSTTKSRKLPMRRSRIFSRNGLAG